MASTRIVGFFVVVSALGLGGAAAAFVPPEVHGPPPGAALAPPGGGAGLAPPSSEAHAPVAWAARASATPVPRANPLHDPRCEGLRITVTADAEDERGSFAILHDRAGTAHLGRRGTVVGADRIAGIRWDRVWLATAKGRCQVVLGEPAPAETPPGGREEAARRPPRGGGPASADVAAQIRRSEDGVVRVERDLVERVLADPKALVGARVTKSGDGFVVRGIAPGSLLDRVGVANGDRLRSLNGVDLSDVGGVLAAMPRLRSADRWVLMVDRGGQERSVEVLVE